MDQGTKTSKIGIFLLDDGTWRIVVNARHPVTRKRVVRRKVVAAELTLSQVVEERVLFMQALHDELTLGRRSASSTRSALKPMSLAWTSWSAPRATVTLPGDTSIL